MENTTPPSVRTTVHRVPARARYDQAFIHAVLDEGLVAHVGLIQDGQPFVLPMAYARLGDQLILHGARASRLQQQGVAGLPLCVTVTLLDGLVLARSAFHHSMNYRSVVVLGVARELTLPDEKRRALHALVDHALAGRSQQARPPDDKELHATRVLSLPLGECSAKARSGGPLDDPEDLALPVWAGHLPLALRADPPVTDGASGPPPASLTGWRR